MKKQLLANKKGATLVELLIGIVILGIIVGPLLHTFVSSAGTAAKSGRMGDATLAAQNIAETLETTDLSGLLANPASVLGGATSAYYDYDSAAKTYTARAQAPVLGQDRYHIGVTGLSAGGSGFRAMISLEARADAGYTAINDVKLTEYTAMDAVFSQSTNNEDNPDAMAQAAFINKATVESGGSYTPGAKSRKIVVAASKRASNPELMDMKLTYLYDFNYSYSRTVYDDFGKPTGTETVSDVYHDEISYALMPKGYHLSDGEPSVYLLYNPWYGSGITDQIVIENKEDIPMRFFLVKQKTAGLTEAELTAKENTYRAEIQLRHSEGVAEENETKLFSNAGYHLVTGAALGGVKSWIYYGDFSRNSYRCSGELVSKTAQNRFYQVKIALYRNEDDFNAAPLYVAETTLLQ